MRNFLTKDEYSVFEDFMDIYSELVGFVIEEGFVKGFSMANRFRDESIEK